MSDHEIAQLTLLFQEVIFSIIQLPVKACCGWCYVVKAPASLEKSFCMISAWMNEDFGTEA